ncbi:MAG: HDOD domain-containing protein [Deltaproteobacteria bacterium]|nr:MAG: HDOD domain-containing protein [Deltaproteobacteria bacterium]
MLMMKIDIAHILPDIKSLPPFPEVTQKVITTLDDPEVGIQELVEIVQYDPNLTANILKMSNSAYFGFPREVHSLNQALLYLGTQNLFKIIIASGATRLYGRCCNGYILDQGELWRHSVSTAVMASVISRWLGVPDGALLFTAALLHDIGKLVLDYYVHDAFTEIMALVKEGNYAFQEAERAVIGIDHAAVGGEIARQWNFPDKIRLAIAYHHLESPEALKNDLALLVYLADLLVIILGANLGVDGLAYRGHPWVMKHFGLRVRHLEQLLALFWPEMQKAQEFFNLDFRV